jgi:hypothetical protein
VGQAREGADVGPEELVRVGERQLQQVFLGLLGFGGLLVLVGCLDAREPLRLVGLGLIANAGFERRIGTELVAQLERQLVVAGKAARLPWC